MSDPTLEQAIAQLGNYQNIPRLRNDVITLHQKGIRSLTPNIGLFQSPNNQTLKLFFLGGTIKIIYKGASYNIPLTLYLDPPYPNCGPRCFVSPIVGMQIKSRHPQVDRSGMIYLPYLHQWNNYNSNLHDLIMHMSQLFGQNPPVFSVPGSQPSTQRPQQAITGCNFGGQEQVVPPPLSNNNTIIVPNSSGGGPPSFGNNNNEQLSSSGECTASVSGMSRMTTGAPQISVTGWSRGPDDFVGQVVGGTAGPLSNLIQNERGGKSGVGAAITGIATTGTTGTTIIAHNKGQQEQSVIKLLGPGGGKGTSSNANPIGTTGGVTPAGVPPAGGSGSVPSSVQEGGAVGSNASNANSGTSNTGYLSDLASGAPRRHGGGEKNDSGGDAPLHHQCNNFAANVGETGQIGHNNNYRRGTNLNAGQLNNQQYLVQLTGSSVGLSQTGNSYTGITGISGTGLSSASQTGGATGTGRTTTMNNGTTTDAAISRYERYHNQDGANNNLRRNDPLDNVMISTSSNANSGSAAGTGTSTTGTCNKTGGTSNKTGGTQTSNKTGAGAGGGGPVTTSQTGGASGSEQQGGNPLSSEPQPQFASLNGQPFGPYYWPPNMTDAEKKNQLLISLNARAKINLPLLIKPVHDSISEQLDVQERLNSHAIVCKETLKSMEQELESQKRMILILDETQKQAEAAIIKAKSDAELDVDAFLEPTDALNRQLLDLIAEEQSYEDAVAFLFELLSQRLLLVDDWMFEIRDIFKRQFFVKETKKKAIRVIRARKTTEYNS